jgi:hypothetical protein
MNWIFQVIQYRNSNMMNHVEIGIFSTYQAAYKAMLQNIRFNAPTHYENKSWLIKKMSKNEASSQYEEWGTEWYSEENSDRSFWPSNIYKKMIEEGGSNAEYRI